MPFYEYECSSCKFYSEVLQKITDAPMRKCPSCGKNAMKKLVSAPVFRLKGSGWYETDFKSEQENKRNLADTQKEAAADAKPDTKADDKADAKPAAAEKDTPKADNAGKPAKPAGRPVPINAARSKQARSAKAAKAASRRPLAKSKAKSARKSKSRR